MRPGQDGGANSAGGEEQQQWHCGSCRTTGSDATRVSSRLFPGDSVSVALENQPGPSRSRRVCGGGWGAERAAAIAKKSRTRYRSPQSISSAYRSQCSAFMCRPVPRRPAYFTNQRLTAIITCTENSAGANGNAHSGRRSEILRRETGGERWQRQRQQPLIRCGLARRGAIPVLLCIAIERSW